MKIMSRRLRPSTVTLYNHLGTAAGIASYQRTVLRRVCLNTGYQQSLSMRGVSTTDKAQMILELRDLDAGGRAYAPLPVWTAAADKSKLFTFSAEKDFFIEGAVLETLPPLTKQQMISLYPVFSVTSCSVPATGADACILVVTGK